MGKRAEILNKAKMTTKMPATAIYAMKVLRDPNANMGEMVQAISYDQGLTVNILKFANSSYYGFSKSISTLSEALVRLGASSVYNMLTASMTNASLSQEIRGYRLASGELWEHSIACAIATQMLADQLKLKDMKFAFTAGLLHDFGKVVLGKFIDEKVCSEIEFLVQKGRSFYESEKAVLGINHAELGAVIMKTWNIPDTLTEVVRWHHKPDALPENQVAALVNIADHICLRNNIGTRPGAFVGPFDTSLIETFKITPEIANEVIDQTRNSLAKIKDVFSKRD